MAYKNMDNIVANIGPTASILKNCSFDYNGNPNILLKIGGIKKQYELDSPTLQSEVIKHSFNYSMELCW